jgi:hypothetical protein
MMAAFGPAELAPIPRGMSTQENWRISSMRGILLTFCMLVPAILIFGGCDNKKISTPSKTVEASKEKPSMPPVEGAGDKEKKKDGDK